MGSGKNAKESSSKSLKMLENLLLAGFQKETSIELINSSLMNQRNICNTRYSNYRLIQRKY